MIKGVSRMQKQICLIVALCVAISEIGCQPTSSNENSNAVNGTVTNGQRLDFEALLTSVDNAIGKRFQSMQMDAMESATYQYDGPIQTVLDIVAPIAKKSGFSEETVDLTNGMGAAEQEMQKKMGIDMKPVEQKMFTHPSGDTLIVSRMDMSNNDLDMKMLTIQLMNPKKFRLPTFVVASLADNEYLPHRVMTGVMKQSAGNSTIATYLPFRETRI